MTTAHQSGETLDPESLALLLNEVSAMAASGRSLNTGLVDLESASRGKLKRACDKVRSQLDRGQSAAESLASLSGEFRNPIHIAMELMTTTRSVEPVNEAVRLIRETRRDRQQTRLAAINPILNVLVGAAILFFVIPWILVSLSQAELVPARLSPTASEIGALFAGRFALAAIATLAVVVFFAALVIRALKRSEEQGDPMRNHATFCRWLQLQLCPASRPANESGSDLDSGTVIDNASAVVSPSFHREWSPVAERVRNGATSPDSLAMPPGTPDLLRDGVLNLVRGEGGLDALAVDFQRLAELYSQRAEPHNLRWAILFPQVLSWMLLILLIMILLGFILAPLFRTLSEVL